MRFEFSEQVLAEMRAHAAAAYPDECCGMVVERDGQAAVVRIENIQNELHAKDPQQFPRTAATAYTMRYKDVEPILEAAYRGELRLLAVYHSHPEHDSYFSEQDQAAAAGWVDDPNYAAAAQLVFSVRQGNVVDVKAFFWDDGARLWSEGSL